MQAKLMTFVKTNAAQNLKIRNTKQKEKQWRVNGWILNCVSVLII